MEKEKTAGLRPLKGNESSKLASDEGWKRPSSKLAFLGAVMSFLSNVGRVLNVIEKLWAWWNDS